jgi:hypothetical protein
MATANESNRSGSYQEVSQRIKEAEEALTQQRSELRTLRRQEKLRKKIMKVGPQKFERFAALELAWRQAELQFLQELVEERRRIIASSPSEEAKRPKRRDIKRLERVEGGVPRQSGCHVLNLS